MRKPPNRLMLAGIAMLAPALWLAGPAAAAETYKIDRDHTEIRFTYDHMGLTTQAGRFLDYDASLTFDEASPEAAVLEVTIAAASVTTDVEALDKILRGPDFFDAARHPRITFKSTKVIRTAAKAGRVTGDLTIRGVTKPVTLDVALNFAGGHPLAQMFAKYKDAKAVAFSARAQILRSDFGLGKFAPLTSDTVVITIESELLHKP